MDNRKKYLLIGLLIGVFGTCLIGSGAFLLGRVLHTDINSGKNAEKQKEGSASLITEEVSGKLDAMTALVDYYYLEDVDRKKLTEGLYKGLTEALEDPYSDYYDSEEAASLKENIDGTYCGIGATLTKNPDTSALTVIRCFQDTPSMEAGLLPGDVIVSVDGTEVTDMEVDEAVSMIKGEEGTSVTLRIYREGQPDYMDIKLEREKINIPTVAESMLDDQVGYIQMVSFDQVTSEQFEDAYERLIRQGMEALIVDLRDNPGGRLDVVCDIADLFVPKGLIVYTEDKYGHRVEYKAEDDDAFSRPLAVLVNENSASASEIFAGAVQDTGMGTIVGTTTYGKGVVQQIIDLGDGTTMKLTTSKYYTPNGNDIDHKGITPDISVELDEALLTKSVITVEEDNQLQAALKSLREQLNARAQ